jgi:hypothetical protein
MSTQELVLASQNQLATADSFMPTLTIEQALERYGMMAQFVEKVLRKDLDFGVIPGATKPSLYKPGAEKLSTIFGLSPEFIYDVTIEDWLGEQYGEPFFAYRLRCRLTKNGVLIGEGVGAANSWESKYRYRWITADELPADMDLSTLRSRDGRKSHFEFDFALEKRETGGKYGKPPEYWEAFAAAIQGGQARRIEKETKSGKRMGGWEMTVGAKQYRIPNPDIADVVNTVLKMAKKRAHVDAVLNGTNASDFFTQDVEDYAEQLEESYDELRTRKIAEAEAHIARQQNNPKQQTGSGKTVETSTAGETARAAAKPEQSSEIPAASTPGSQSVDEVAPAVEKLWQQMGVSMTGICKVFAQFKSQLVADSGNEEEYYLILAKHGFAHSNDVKQLGVAKARRCVRDLYEAVEAWKKRNEPPPDPMHVTQDDAEAVLSGK